MQSVDQKGVSVVQVTLAAVTVLLMAAALWIKSSLVLWMVLEAAVFVPAERIFNLRPQKVLRRHWHTDIVYSVMTATLVNAGLVTVVAAAFWLGRHIVPMSLVHGIRHQLGLVQFVEAVLLTELCSYLAHRFCHRNKIMWKFHALHHSIEEMDWLAAARVHPVDQIFTRACVLIPVTVLFPKTTLALYLVLSGFQSFFIHSNIRLTFGPLRYLVATPEFHHWHHANQKKAYDTNFSNQFPWMDALFGTLFMPKGERPAKFGISDQPPDGYLRQLAWSITYSPWTKSKKDKSV